MKNYEILSVSMIALALTLGACSPSDPDKAPQAVKVTPAPALSPAPQKQQSTWIDSSFFTSDHAAKLTRSEMPKSEQDAMREEYRQTDLVPIPVDPKFNVNMFKIRNVSEWENVAFIAPKVFAYGSSENARSAPQRNEDGTVSIPFPIVLIDGMQDEIQGPDTVSKIQVPGNVQIQHAGSLEEAVDSAMGVHQAISVLPGCPKKITVRVNDTEYDATPTSLANGDYCQMNTPFTATLRVPEETARYILEKALYAASVDVMAIYETRVAFTVAKLALEFDKAKLFQDIEAELGVNAGPYVDAEVRAKVTGIVRRQAFKLRAQGEIGPALQTIIDQAIKEFFEPFIPDPKKGQKECSGAVVCLRLNYNYSKEEQTFRATWEQSTNALTGQNYLTWTKLKPLQDHVIRIGDMGIDAPCQKTGTCRPPIRQEESFETGLIVAPGDLLEIAPSFLIKEERQFDIPTSVRTSNVVCTASEPVYEWRTHCNGGGGHDSGGNCQDYQRKVGDRCIATEDHWSEVTTYSMSKPKFVQIDQPTGQIKEIYEGLYLKFTWRKNGDGGDGSAREVTCPLSLFKREGDGKSLTARIENQPGCQIFSGNPSESPMLHLVNKIEFPVTYKDGSETHYWNHTMKDNTSAKTYIPEIRFAGSVGIRGYAFGSEYVR